MKAAKKLTALTMTALLAAAMTLPTLAADESFGSAAVSDQGSYSLEQMLTYSIEDEFLALAEYEKIVATFGDQRPFSNIIEAETTHISALEPLFEQYGVPLPENTGEEYAVIPDTLTAAFRTGVDAEVNNIAMYETFLGQDLPDDVRTVFTALQKASENHLRAFENGVARSDRWGGGAVLTGGRWGR